MAFHQYNKFKYNTAQYNADAIFYVQACAETVSSSDAHIDTPTKVLAETITDTDARVMMLARTLVEFMFLADTITKSILNKGMAETVRVNDWLEIERNNRHNGNGWS